MRKSEILERLSIILVGIAIGITVGAIGMAYSPPWVGFFVSPIVLLISFFIGLWGENEKSKEDETWECLKDSNAK
jgi:hypothetical protein